MQRTHTQIAAMADAISGSLRLARGMVRAGRHIDLAGLEAEVGRLCADCLSLPSPRAHELRPRVDAVLADLDALAAAMRDRAP
jgi:hypothetical protein